MKTRNQATYIVADVPQFKKKALAWAAKHEPCSYLDSNNRRDKYSRYDALIAVGNIEGGNDWLFGHLGYDLKNDIEQLESKHPDGINLPDSYFFCPETLVLLRDEAVTILTNLAQPDDIWETIAATIPITDDPLPDGPPNIQARISQPEYLGIINKILAHLQRGDIFEMNFCQEFYAQHTKIHPPALFQRLNEATRTPFAAYYRCLGKHLMCASPERFLQKNGHQLRSQPIKGTRPRSADPAIDEQLRAELQNSPKDRAEHVMIVDLVRNDLSRICVAGTVSVEDIYSIHRFEFVHQMISTIVGDVRPQLSHTDILRATFPMGSMTGAPKVRAMQLAEQYEQTRRGLYAGTVGYITPWGDFDFNVVIRSMLYNPDTQYLSFQVGGAITIGSDPQAEYDECMVKAAGILRVLGSSI